MNAAAIGVTVGATMCAIIVVLGWRAHRRNIRQDVMVLRISTNTSRVFQMDPEVFDPGLCWTLSSEGVTCHRKREHRGPHRALDGDGKLVLWRDLQAPPRDRQALEKWLES